MSGKSVIPCILPNEFAAFATLLAADPKFPKTYASWLQLTYRSDIGKPLTSVDVHPHEFADHCRQQQQEPSAAALRQFATLKALQQANA